MCAEDLDHDDLAPGSAESSSWRLRQVSQAYAALAKDTLPAQPSLPVIDRRTLLGSDRLPAPERYLLRPVAAKPGHVVQVLFHGAETCGAMLEAFYYALRRWL